MVYIDPNVFNYTEANNRIEELDNVGGDSCRLIAIYTFCISVYPHCNNATQALVPPCMDECMEFSDFCRLTRFLSFTTIPNLNQDALDGQLLLSCSDPYRLFDVTINDTENCFNFNCKLTYCSPK